MRLRGVGGGARLWECGAWRKAIAWLYRPCSNKKFPRAYHNHLDRLVKILRTAMHFAVKEGEDLLPAQPPLSPHART